MTNYSCDVWMHVFKKTSFVDLRMRSLNELYIINMINMFISAIRYTV